MLNAGEVLQNRYRIISQLGQGGMGAVYHAWDTRLSIPVALKEMIPPADLDSQVLGQLRNQFQQEATILARLDHPYLVGVTDFFEEERNIYLVMKYVEGESLAERIQREGALAESTVVTWSVQLLDALSYCHSQGVIHRDIKPQNIIIRPDGDAVLVDFGLVKLWDPNDPQTRTAVRGVGTPQYAPPEQYELDAGHTEPRSDVYSLGATMYHALTGQAPPTATMRIAAPEDFEPIRQVATNVSDSTANAIEQAMELARSRRWATAAEMAAALGVSIRDWGSATPGSQTPVDMSGRGGTVRMDEATLGGQRRRMPKWIWGAVGVLALLILVGGVWALSGGLGPQAQVLLTPTETEVLTPVLDMNTPSPTSTATETATATSTLTPETVPTETSTPTPEPSPTPTEELTATPTDIPTLEPSPTSVPTDEPAAQSDPSPTPVVIAPTPTPPPQEPASGELGRIILTVQIGDGLFLYSTDPTWGQMKEIGRTDYGLSTCGGGAVASTITGQTIGVYGVSLCNITERTDACTSPNGNHRVITNFVKDVGWTVNLENVADGSSQWYYQGSLNRAIGVQWSPNSRYAIFGVRNAISLIPVGGDMRQVIDYLDVNWPPQFSPDGSIIYFLKPVGSAGASDVFAVNADTNATWNMTNAPGAQKMCPRWRR